MQGNPAGIVEKATWRNVVGWVRSAEDHAPVAICVFQDNVLVAMGEADAARPDRDGGLGFDVALPPGVRQRPRALLEVRTSDGVLLEGCPILMDMQPIGYVDVARPDCIAGWVHDPARPPLTVELVVAGQVMAVAVADKERGDLASIVENGRCAFELRLPDPDLRLCAEGFVVRVAGSEVALPRCDRPLAAQTGQDACPAAPQASLCNKPQLVAFYLPQFHPIPENDVWWGKNFTEWNSVTKAVPLFRNHLQPRLPADLGFYNLLDPATRNAQFALARGAGVDAFCYYYYWFGGRRVLERPLEDVLHDRVDPFPFCLCWANENWTRRWDGRDEQLLLEQVHSLDSDRAIFNDLLPYLQKPNYLRLAGRPVLLVYRPQKMVDPRQTTDMWREMARQSGLGELHLAAVQAFGLKDPRPLGFDAAVEFPPHFDNPAASCRDIRGEVGLGEDFPGHIYDYDTVVDAALARKKTPYRLHRGVMAAWDNTPRRGINATVFHGASPRRYGQWLSGVIAQSLDQPDPLVFINAWNEWGEGAVLEPSAMFGDGYLRATAWAKRKAAYACQRPEADAPGLTLCQGEECRGGGVALIGHDANCNGAQMILLNIARGLKARGVRAVILLYRGGPLLSKFADLYETRIINDDLNHPEQLKSIMESLVARDITRVITNTVVVGHIVAHCKKAGMRVVSLIHELPRLILQQYLGEQAHAMAIHADALIFPARYVADSFRTLQFTAADKIRILPQGCYRRMLPDDATVRRTVRQELREYLDIDPDSRIVLGCGYADHRKGFDLFLSLAASFAQALPSVHFLWVGDLEDDLARRVAGDLERVLAGGNCTRLDFKEGVERFYGGADVFVLTSREDPFPSVLLEAFAAGLPAVGFADAGGFDAHVPSGLMHLVPYLNLHAMAESIGRLLADPGVLAAAAAQGPAYIERFYRFEDYVDALLRLTEVNPADAGRLPAALPSRPTVSVVIPNYNYAPYLSLRLLTVIHQTVPPDEIIILDDGSTDDSLAIIRDFAAQSPTPVTIVASETNTGNPFIQWQKGIQAARCELVWMAEADDYCELDFLERLLPAFDDAAVGLAYCHSRPVGAGRESLGFSYDDYLTEISPTLWRHHFKYDGRRFLEQYMCWRNPIPNASAVVFRRSAIPEAAYEARQFRFFGDWYFYTQCLANSKVAFVADCLNYHRRHPQSAIAFVEKSHIYIDELLRVFEALLRQDGLRLTRGNRYRMLKALADDWGKRLAGLSPDDPVLAELAARSTAVIQGVLTARTPDPRPMAGLRILIVIGDAHVGGGQNAAIRLANCLCRDNTVYVLNARPRMAGTAPCLPLDPQVHVVDEPRSNLALTNAAHGLSESPARLAALVQCIQSWNIDVVNSHLWWADRLVAKLRERIPFTWVVSLHGCYEFLLDHPRLDAQFHALAATVFRLANGLTCASPKNLDIVGVTGKNAFMEIRQLNHGYAPQDVGVRRPQPGRLTCVMVARGIPEKGWDSAIAALDALDAARPGQCRLILVGGSEYLTALEARHAHKDYLDFRGYQQNPAASIREADVAILPTRFVSESLPLSLMECLHYGLPVIATDVGDIGNMLGQGGLPAGLLLPLDEDPDRMAVALAKAITAYLDPGLWAVHSRNAAIRAASLFSEDGLHDNALTVFRLAMEQTTWRQDGPPPDFYGQFRQFETVPKPDWPSLAPVLVHPVHGEFLGQELLSGLTSRESAPGQGLAQVRYEACTGLVRLLASGDRPIVAVTPPFELGLLQQLTVCLTPEHPLGVPCGVCLALVTAQTDEPVAESDCIPLAATGETQAVLAAPLRTDLVRLVISLRVGTPQAVAALRLTGIWGV